MSRASDYNVAFTYGRMTAADRDGVIRFWLENRAIVDPAEAHRRAAEVACLGRNQAGAIVGVTSIYLAPFTRPDAPHYFFRMFMRPADRVLGLSMRMVRTCVEGMTDPAARAREARGMILITENPKLMLPGPRRMLDHLGWRFWGKSPQGLDIWRIAFADPSGPA